MNLDAGYRRLAELLEEGGEEIQMYIYQAGWDVEHLFPDEDGDSLGEMMWNDLDTRIEQSVGLSWDVSGMGGGGIALGTMRLTPDSVWIVKLEFIMELEIWPVSGHASLDAANAALIDNMPNLFFDSGPPHSMSLGPIENPTEWAREFLMSRLAEPDSNDPMNWAALSGIVEDLDREVLPYGSQSERTLLLDRYLNAALNR
jgi:hypothetical protein